MITKEGNRFIVSLSNFIIGAQPQRRFRHWVFKSNRSARVLFVSFPVSTTQESSEGKRVNSLIEDFRLAVGPSREDLTV